MTLPLSEPVERLRRPACVLGRQRADGKRIADRSKTSQSVPTRVSRLAIAFPSFLLPPSSLLRPPSVLRPRSSSLPTFSISPLYVRTHPAGKSRAHNPTSLYMPPASPRRTRYKLAPEVHLLTIEYVAGDAREPVDPVARKTLASVRL